jgi:hypothetical protein
LAAITRRRTRIAAVRGIARGERATGNTAQYQALVFNFAPTWESIYLNFVVLNKITEGIASKLASFLWFAFYGRDDHAR